MKSVARHSSLLSYAAQLAQEYRPSAVISLALVVIVILDIGLTLVNAVHYMLDCLAGVDMKAAGLPPAFSPSKPPPFEQWPVTHLCCRLIRVYNWCSGYDRDLHLRQERFSQVRRNDWIRDWAYWDGAGHQGCWSAAVPTQDTDRRSPCPGLNLLATHGIIDTTGRNISGSQLVVCVSRVFAIAPTMALQLYSPLFARFAFHNHTFALKDVGMVDVIEHDASLLRPDHHMVDWRHDPHAMSRPHQHLIDRLLPLAVKTSLAREQLTETDFAKALRERRTECKQANNEYTSSVKQSLIGAGSCCLMLRVFDGYIPDLRDMAGTINDNLPGIRTTLTGQRYGYERIPRTNHWQPATANRYFGLTILEALYVTLKIEVLARMFSSPSHTYLCA